MLKTDSTESFNGSKILSEYKVTEALDRLLADGQWHDKGECTEIIRRLVPPDLLIRSRQKDLQRDQNREGRSTSTRSYPLETVLEKAASGLLHKFLSKTTGRRNRQLYEYERAEGQKRGILKLRQIEKPRRNVRGGKDAIVSSGKRFTIEVKNDAEKFRELWKRCVVIATNKFEQKRKEAQEKFPEFKMSMELNNSTIMKDVLDSYIAHNEPKST